MSNKSNYLSTQSAVNCIAYERLTGQKPPPTSLSHKSANSSKTTNSNNSGNNGTGHWAAGMAKPDEVLGNLGIDSKEVFNDLSRNTTWDHPPQGLGCRLDQGKDYLSDHKSRGKANRRNSGSDKRAAGCSSQPSNSMLVRDVESKNLQEGNYLSKDYSKYSCKSSINSSKSGSSPQSHDSCASSPSSNSNSLTKHSCQVLDDCIRDRRCSTSSSYFNLTNDGKDQLEVLSDSGDSLSPDTAGGGLAESLPQGTCDVYCDLDVGSMVEITIRGVQRFGVIRWIGTVSGEKREGRMVAGVELEDGTDGLSDGTFNGRRHFTCAPGKAIFVYLSMCQHDSRFLESMASCATNSRASIVFGSEDSGPIQGRVAPPGGKAVLSMLGRNKGIQGHQNSCYLDATLFSMFAFTSVFDSLLFRPATPFDISEYNEVQKVLREEIVNPLRSRMFVRADRIMKLRTLLDNLSSVRGLTTEEKDPEEFLHSLLAQILKAEPYLQLSSGQETYHYQLFVDKDDKIPIPSVQHLFDQSFLTSDIKLKQVPAILILQMPRFGKDYKMYSRILPSLLLDVTDVIEDSPRQCNICGQVAELECPQCFGQCGTGLESIAFCNKCIHKVHTHKKRDSHNKVRRLRVPEEYRELSEQCCVPVPRIFMELFAVVCIETSHYVTFTRCGEGPEAPWCFFDSMADRKGEQHGYNIPNVEDCGELLELLGDPAGSAAVSEIKDDKALPHLTRRLLCDAYMCFYQTSKIAMYR